MLTHYTPRAQVRTPKWDQQTPLYGRDRMTLRVRRILRVSRQLEAAQIDGTEEAVQRVWARAKDVRSWNADLEDRGWGSEETLRILKRMAKQAIADDEKDRLAAWRDKMEWCENDAIRWIRLGEDIPKGEGIGAVVDWQQQADQIREELAKLVHPAGYPRTPHARAARIRAAREMAKRVRPSREVPGDFRVPGSLIKRYLNKAAGTASGAGQWKADQLCELPEDALDELAAV